MNASIVRVGGVNANGRLELDGGSLTTLALLLGEFSGGNGTLVLGDGLNDGVPGQLEAGLLQIGGHSNQQQRGRKRSTRRSAGFKTYCLA